VRHPTQFGRGVQTREGIGQLYTQDNRPTGRRAPDAPGTELVPHPTQFGRGIQTIEAIGRLQLPEPSSSSRGQKYAFAKDDLQRAAENEQQQPRRTGTNPQDRFAVVDPGGAADTSRQGIGDVDRARRASQQSVTALSSAEQQHAENVARVADYEANAAARTEQLNRLYTEQARVLGGTSQAYTRHGALTTEFLSSAARGEATFRELGSQVGLTTAKFAGWTAVSVPIFALAGAVSRVGTGAIEGASGVDQLKRVISNLDADQAQRDFRGLSEAFNVPMGDAAEAVYRMGMVFKDQKQATDAARVALVAYQTGELSVEDATKRLVAITQGFNLGPSGLATIFDQVNAAQNNFGATIPDTLAGLANLGGAFRNAGGDASYALALITTGQKVTGRTGQNLGTAFQRSVGFVQRPGNQKQLREFGIDPTQNIDSIYDQAFVAARNLQGEKLQQLAGALSSPQYASYFVPLLQNEDMFRKVQQGKRPRAPRRTSSSTGSTRSASRSRRSATSSSSWAPTSRSRASAAACWRSCRPPAAC
jgi:hypothetical protein